MRQRQLLLCAAAAVPSSARYTLDSSFYGVGFFDNFNFYTNPDPTLGFVQYVNRTFANQTSMLATSDTQAAWGVDNTEVFNASAAFGRYSVRLTSNEAWTHGLFVLNLAHMPPNQCGVWPAFWTLGTAPEADKTWPNSGEIDIIEYANTGALNLMSLHTSADEECTIAGSGQTGTLLTNNCAISGPNGGCSVSAVDAAIEGNVFNTNMGGVFAMEWTSRGIKIWYWPAGTEPPALKSRTGTAPDPSRWGAPVANFQGSCDFDARLFNHSIVFDTTFCGSYAGNTFAADNCPLLDPANGWTSCNEFVANNPQAFVDAYWQVNWLNVYTTPAIGAPTKTASRSSILPAASTSPVSTMPVPGMGQTTTPSLSLLVTSSPVDTNFPPPASTMSTSTIAARVATVDGVAPVLQKASTNQDVLDTRTPGEIPAGCRELPPGPVPAPEPMPQCYSARKSSTSHTVREAEAQVGGVPGGSTSFCSVPGMDCDHAISNTSKREPQVGGGSVGFCSVPGMDCNEHFEGNNIIQRDPLPQGGGSISFCGVAGGACQHEVVDSEDKTERKVHGEHLDATLVPPRHSVEATAASLMLPSSPQTSSITTETFGILPRDAKDSRIEVSRVNHMFTSPTLPLGITAEIVDNLPRDAAEASTEISNADLMLPSATLPSFITTEVIDPLPSDAGTEIPDAQLIMPSPTLPSFATTEIMDNMRRGAANVRTEITNAVLMVPSAILPPGIERRDGSGINLLPHATKSFVAVVPVKREEVETGLNAKTSSTLSPSRRTAACIPALVHAPEGDLTASGCLLLSGALPTNTNPLEAVNTTTTLSNTAVQGTPHLSDGALALSEQSNGAAENCGYSVGTKSYAVVAAVVFVVSLLTLRSNGIS